MNNHCTIQNRSYRLTYERCSNSLITEDIKLRKVGGDRDQKLYRKEERNTHKDIKIIIMKSHYLD